MTRSTTTAIAGCADPQDSARPERHLTVVPQQLDERETGQRAAPRALMRSEAGLATAEYAIATLAAVGFAALLVAVLSSGEIRGMLMSLITNALSFG